MLWYMGPWILLSQAMSLWYLLKLPSAIIPLWLSEFTFMLSISNSATKYVSTYENWHKSFWQCKHCIVLRDWKKKVSGNEIILRINPAYHPLFLENWSFSYGHKSKWTEFLFKELIKIIWTVCLEKNRLRKGSLNANRKLHRRIYQHAHAIRDLFNCRTAWI